MIKTLVLLCHGETNNKKTFQYKDLKVSGQMGGASKNCIFTCIALRDILKILFLSYDSAPNPISTNTNVIYIPLIRKNNVSPSFELIKVLQKNKSLANENEIAYYIFNKFLSALLIKLIKPNSKVMLSVEGNFKEAIWSYYISNIFIRFIYCLASLFSLLFIDTIIVDKKVNWLNTKSPSFLKSKVIFLPNSVDTEIFKPLSCIKKENQYINLLQIGRDFPKQKNPQLLFKSFYLINKVINSTRLTVIGMNKVKGLQYIDNIEIVDKINFIEFVDHNEIFKYHQLNDLLLITSFFEGTPHVILESLACGTPCISTNVIDDGIIANGVNGYICNSFNPEDFSNLAIKGLELSQKLKENNKSLLPEIYDLKNRKNNLLKILK